jgi:hypothetical protein
MFVAIEGFLNTFFGPSPHTLVEDLIAGAALVAPFAVLTVLFSFPWAALAGFTYTCGFMTDAWTWTRRLRPLASAFAIALIVALLV